MLSGRLPLDAGSWRPTVACQLHERCNLARISRHRDSFRPRCSSTMPSTPSRTNLDDKLWPLPSGADERHASEGQLLPPSPIFARMHSCSFYHSGPLNGGLNGSPYSFPGQPASLLSRCLRSADVSFLSTTAVQISSTPLLVPRYVPALPSRPWSSEMTRSPLAVRASRSFPAAVAVRLALSPTSSTAQTY